MATPPSPAQPASRVRVSLTADMKFGKIPVFSQCNAVPRVECREKDMAKYLDPKADVTFKKVFGEHENLVMGLLNALLPLSLMLQDMAECCRSRGGTQA